MRKTRSYKMAHCNRGQQDGKITDEGRCFFHNYFALGIKDVEMLLKELELMPN